MRFEAGDLVEYEATPDGIPRWDGDDELTSREFTLTKAKVTAVYPNLLKTVSQDRFNMDWRWPLEGALGYASSQWGRPGFVRHIRNAPTCDCNDYLGDACEECSETCRKRERDLLEDLALPESKKPKVMPDDQQLRLFELLEEHEAGWRLGVAVQHIFNSIQGPGTKTLLKAVWFLEREIQKRGEK